MRYDNGLSCWRDCFLKKRVVNKLIKEERNRVSNTVDGKKGEHTEVPS